MTDFNPTSLGQMDKDRLSAYKANLAFYNGEQWPTAQSKNRQLVFNYAKIAIDKLTSYLTDSLNFSCVPADGSDAAKKTAREAEAVLYQVYSKNNLQELDYETEIDAAILGDGC